MKFENFTSTRLSNLNSANSQLQSQSQLQLQNQQDDEVALQPQPQHFASTLTNANLRRQRHSGNGFGGGLFACGFSDRDSVCSAHSARSKRIRSRNIPMKSSKSVMKKTKVMDYTNYAYNEAVGRLKLMLADSYATTGKGTFASSGPYLRNFSEDSADNFSDNLSVIERPVYSDISKYLSPSQKSRFGSSYRKKPVSGFSASKENLAAYQPIATTTAAVVPPLEYISTPKAQFPVDSVQAPAEIFNFIEKQEDYIEQLEKESKYCRNELTNLLGKVKDVINENEHLTETARSELAAMAASGAADTQKSKLNLSPSSEDSEATVYASIKKPNTPRKKESTKSPRFANAPSIVYEARISELEAELTQANIDLKRLRTENDELKRKLARTDTVAALTGQSSTQLVSVVNCDVHRKQIETFQTEKTALENTIRHLQKSLDDVKAQQYNVSSKRYVNDLLQMERSQAELEVKHLRDELDRQHERVRELQHEMARRIAEERSNAERRYNTQVDQLGGDLSNQWEQVAKLQLELERQKRYETDLKRDLANRNAQIEELKMELRSNRSTFLADMAQANAEKQSLEQEITALRLQLDRAAREAKTEASRYNAELNSLRQRLDRGDADLLHSKREILRLNDEIANLEKELAYGEMKNEVRPTKKDLDKRISEMQEKHAETVNELEEMIQSQKKLMDKLTTECKMLTNKLEDTTLKNNKEKQRLWETNTQLLERLKQLWASYKDLSMTKRQMQRRRHSFYSIGSTTTDSTTDSNREEHFSKTAPIFLKSLSTTSRPCLMQPTPHIQPMVMHHTQAPTPLPSVTSPSPLPITTTIQYSVKAQQVPATYSEQQKLLQQLQQRLSMMPSIQQKNMSQAPMPSVSTKLVTANMDSAIMTTKISRTTLVQVKSNSNSNNSSNNNNNKSQQIIAAKQSSTKTKSQMNQQKQLQQLQQQHSTPMKVGDSVQQTIMVPLTTVPTKVTIPHNTIQAPMIPVPTIKHSTMPVNTVAPVHTTQAADKPTIPIPPMQTIPQVSTIQASISNMAQQSTNQRHQQQKKTLHHHHQRSPHHHQHHQHNQRQRLRLIQPELSPRSQLAVQQQKAEHNRARAQELWGQQVLQEQENPRPPLKSNYAENEICDPIDPLELELNISSPSLLRTSSVDSDSDRTAVADMDFDSVTDMSISPAPTAIRRLPINPERVMVKKIEATKPKCFNTL